MILVVGATGLLGGEICKIIAKENKYFKSLVRETSDQNKIKNLGNMGELIYGDLKNPHSLDEACQDIDTIISTASSTLSRQDGDSIQTVDLEGQINLIESAKLAGVKHFIFISFRNNPNISYPLTKAKREVENHLKKNGLKYTVIQASWFMEIWLSAALGFDYENNSVRIYGEGKNKISWISYKDVAKFSAASVNNPNLMNRIIEIGGPEALSPIEVVKIFEERKNSKFSIEFVKEEILQSQMMNEQDPLIKSFNGLMLQYAKGDEIDMTGTKNLLATELITIRDYAENKLNAVFSES